jgi:hypothetical protein
VLTLRFKASGDALCNAIRMSLLQQHLDRLFQGDGSTRQVPAGPHTSKPAELFQTDRGRTAPCGASSVVVTKLAPSSSALFDRAIIGEAFAAPIRSVTDEGLICVVVKPYNLACNRPGLKVHCAGDCMGGLPVPSAMGTIRSTPGTVKCSTLPLGQCTSMSSTLVVAPRPK